ncbi:hypothetical protein [Bdellovibrio sp. HCB209]|uniref:hypothetical protein n=1 Tax=Bdellovibrio sp. HCB209 TaxID=3394354 RepID=UPI0039B3D8B0
MLKAVFFTLLMSISLVTSAAFATAPSCSSVFAQSPFKESNGKPIPEGKDLVIALKEQKESQKVSRFMMDDFKRQSEAFKKQNKGKVIELDFLCVGAGPQCAAASLVLGRTNAKSLVVEKTDYVAKTFAEKDFYINSVEASNISMHDFPGGFGSMANMTSSVYAHSSQLAAHIQAQQYVSGVPVLLGTRVVSVEKGPGSELLITTDNGITIRAKNLLLGTGLGEIGTKVKDVEYQKAFASFHAEATVEAGLKPIMSTDSFLVAIKQAREQKMGVQLPRDVILIGNGDGSRIAIEAYSDKNVKMPRGFKTHWVGNNFKTAQEYIESQGGWDRYLPKIVPQYEKNRIEGVPGYVEKVEQLANGRFRVTSKDKEGVVRTAEGDMIVDSTGYTSLNAELLRTLLQAPEMIDVLGPLKELNLTETVLARQYREANGSSVPVYALGPAAGLLAKESELTYSPNKNPVAIFNTAARTSQFISMLMGVEPLESKRGARDERPSVKSAKVIIAELKKAKIK